LQFPWGNHHDAFIILAENGNPSSIPLLIAALQWQGDTEEDTMECTKGHCLTALRRLTRADAGANYKGWKRWWKEHRNDQFLELTEKLWSIRWQTGTRERLVSLKREQFTQAGLDDRAGKAWVASIERELPWHPIPSPNLPQTREDKTLDLGDVRLFYRIELSNQMFEIHNFAELPLKAAAVGNAIH
jgi:hypothetical protein